MNIENMRKVCEAARSGKYSQAKQELKSTSNCFCWMGVAANEYLESGDDDYGAHWDELGTFHWTNREGKRCCESGTSPVPVNEWLGVDLEGLEISLACGRTVTVFELNDEFGFSLSDISDAVERQYLN